jgi:acetyltransferase
MSYDGYVAHDFTKLFYPSSVAIVGASETPDTIGNSLRQNLKTFHGPVYYVNPNHTALDGVPCYPDLTKTPNPVDLAVIAVPAKAVPDVVKQAGEAGIRHLVVISSGFKEIGETGAVFDAQIQSLAKEYGITLVGPNCLGSMNPELGLNTSFAGTLPLEGSIAFVSQSGALMTAILDYAKKWHLGFSKCISIGNKSVVDETDVLEYLASDEKTKAILLYVEDIADAARFIAVARSIRQTAHPKPISMLKSGKTTDGARASASHTGALGGVDAYYDAIARQGGITRVSTISDFISMAMVASSNYVPANGAVGIVTNAGGPGIIITDEAVAFGLSIAKLSDGTVSQLSRSLPPSARVHNPVDVLGDAKADRYESAARTLLKDDAVSSLLVLLTPQSGTEITKTAEVIAALPREKPIVTSFMGADAVSCGIGILRDKDIAVTEYPEDAARALGRFSTYATTCELPVPFSFTNVDRAQVEAILSAQPKDQKIVSERDAGKILSAYGLPMLPTIQAASEEETVAAVQKIGMPCAIKISSPAITHKRDVGGVVLNVTAETAAASYQNMMEKVHANVPNAPIAGVLVKAMAPLGVECIIGLVRQPHFGNVIMVGMGGSFVEITKDVAFGVLPVSIPDVRAMISSLHAKAIFDGYRGSAALDVDVLVDCIGRIAHLAADFPEISEIDVNPLTLYPKGKGAYVVDVRMILG